MHAALWIVTKQIQRKKYLLQTFTSNFLRCYHWSHGRKSGGPPPPHDFEGGGHNIKCPPPPPPRFGGWMIITWNEDPFYMLSGVVALIFYFLLVREVCDVRWVPLLCVWNIEPNMLYCILTCISFNDCSQINTNIKHFWTRVSHCYFFSFVIYFLQSCWSSSQSFAHKKQSLENNLSMLENNLSMLKNNLSINLFFICSRYQNTMASFQLLSKTVYSCLIRISLNSCRVVSFWFWHEASSTKTIRSKKRIYLGNITNPWNISDVKKKKNQKRLSFCSF